MTHLKHCEDGLRTTKDQNTRSIKMFYTSKKGANKDKKFNLYHFKFIRAAYFVPKVFE